MTLDSAKPVFKTFLEIGERAYESGKWVTCPWCQEDWNRLAYCKYFQKGRPADTSVCCDCAFTAKGFKYIPLHHDTDGTIIDILYSDVFPMTKLWGANRTRISCDRLVFDVYADTERVKVVNVSSPGEITFLGNNLQALFWIKAKADKATKEEAEKPMGGWGGRGGKGGR